VPGDLLTDFGAFYREREDQLLRFFLRRTRAADVAADLTAETFARALAGRERYDPDLGDQGAWLFGIARNVLSRSVERGRVDDAVRRRLGMEPIVLDDDDLERIVALDGRAVAAAQALPPARRRAVLGRVVEERSYSELAAQLRCSESVVRQHVSRGLAQLRATLEEPS
jgi:RNA polymerase sigma-70 factor (ECF subfamily)